MEKNAISMRVLETQKHWFKTKYFAWLVLAFVAVKVSLILLLPVDNLTHASDLSTDSILAAVNQQRSLRNLAPLKFNDKLALAAQSKSDDMQARHYFAHVDPDGHYIWDKIVAAGYTPYLQLGENLAIEFYDTDSLMAAWMNSPTHRANILQEGFKDQGMGIALGSPDKGQYYSAITNTFGALAVAPAPKKTTPVAPPKTVPTTPKPKPPAPVVTPKPTKTVAGADASSTPTFSTPTSTVPAKGTPISPREGSELAVNNASDYALPPQTPPPATSTATASTSSIQSFSPVAVVGTTQPQKINGTSANRYLILIAGLLLLLYMLFDAKFALKTQFGSLDKKTNNIVLLIISLVVVAFMYWF